jgi:hypothetical protein
MRAAEKDQRARDALFVREQTQLYAKLLRNACKKLSRATTKAQRKIALASMSTAGLHLWILCGGNPDNLAGILRMIARALEGKLQFHDDDLLERAYLHAQRKAQGGRPGWDISIVPTPKQLDDALTILCGRNARPTKRAAIRRAKQLGWLLRAPAVQIRNRGSGQPRTGDLLPPA